jgi:hypothetical protein
MQLIYAIKKSDGTLAHIDSVLNGSQCGCKCPGCGEDLIAKNNGKIKDHHFAHDQDHVCHHGYQTQIHLLSKTILLEAKTLLLPSFDLDFDALLKITIQKEKTILIKDIQSEKRLDTIIPDIRVIDSLNQEYLIEIKVTHAVDDLKKEKIKVLNLSCIEIDLSSFELTSKDQLKTELLNVKKNWKWVYLSDLEKKHEQLKNFTERINLPNSVDQTRYTAHCPLHKIKDKQMTSADFLKDCQSCPFKLATGVFEDHIQCGGKLGIQSHEDLAKWKSTTLKDNQIIKAIRHDDKHFVFPFEQELILGSIFDLWDGKPMLVKQIKKKFAFLVKHDPNESFKRTKEVYGTMYVNGEMKKPNTTIYFTFVKNWYRIP